MKPPICQPHGMKAWRRRVLWLLALGVTVIGSGCGSRTTVGAGRNLSSRNGLEVLNLDIHRASRVGLEIAESTFTQATLASDGLTIEAYNSNFMAGDVRLEIEPVLAQDSESHDLGVVFRVEAVGAGSNFSLVPSYASRDFFGALDRYCKENGITTTVFRSHKLLKDKGIASVVDPSLPRDVAGFRDYIGTRSSSDPFEGIWLTQDGRYTLALIRNEEDDLNRYVAYLLETEEDGWKPGEIKATFQRLEQDGLSVGQWWFLDKSCESLTWVTGPDSIVCTNVPESVPTVIALVRVFPTSREHVAKKSGTCWMVKPGVFVTNAHVVDNAFRVTVGTDRDTAALAAVLAVDRRLDLALLRIEDWNGVLTDIPLSRSTPDVGSEVVVLGYPYVQVLGNELGLTSGVVSAANGVNGDPAQFQISAPIQPGNSGGPVFDENGHVCGVVVMKFRDNLADGVGFAIKSDYLRLLIEGAFESTDVAENDTPGDGNTPREIFQRYESSVLPVWAE